MGLFGRSGGSTETRPVVIQAPSPTTALGRAVASSGRSLQKSKVVAGVQFMTKPTFGSWTVSVSKDSSCASPVNIVPLSFPCLASRSFHACHACHSRLTIPLPQCLVLGHFYQWLEMPGLSARRCCSSPLMPVRLINTRSRDLQTQQ